MVLYDRLSSSSDGCEAKAIFKLQSATVAPDEGGDIGNVSSAGLSLNVRKSPSQKSFGAATLGVIIFPAGAQGHPPSAESGDRGTHDNVETLHRNSICRKS